MSNIQHASKIFLLKGNMFVYAVETSIYLSSGKPIYIPSKTKEGAKTLTQIEYRKCRIPFRKTTVENAFRRWFYYPGKQMAPICND